MLDLNHYGAERLFSKHTGPDVFGATTLQQRMKFLPANITKSPYHQNITFDDPYERTQSWTNDRFAARKNFLKLSTRTAQNFFTPLNSFCSMRHSNR